MGEEIDPTDAMPPSLTDNGALVGDGVWRKARGGVRSHGRRVLAGTPGELPPRLSLIHPFGAPAYEATSASTAALISSSVGGVSRRYHSASRAPRHPDPAAVTAWR